MKDVLFQTRDGIFEILRSCISGHMVLKLKRPIMVKSKVATPQVPIGTPIPSGEFEHFKQVQLLTASGLIKLGPDHSEEMLVFLDVHPYEGIDKPWVCAESQLPPKPKPSNIVELPN